MLGSMVALVLVTIAAGPPPKTLGDDASDLPAGGVTFYEDDNGDVVYETFENGEIERLWLHLLLRT